MHVNLHQLLLGVLADTVDLKDGLGYSPSAPL